MKKVFTLMAIAVISTISMGQTHADSLIIKFKNGYTQIIKLNEPLNDVVKIELAKEIIKSKAKKDKKLQHINSKNANKNSKHKKSKGIINFGNGIKGEWETPNPYLPPANE